LDEPQFNTYDVAFWGPNGMCSSFYLGALNVATRMGEFLGEDVELYKNLLAQGIKAFEKQLFDGEYFSQVIKWRGLNASPDDVRDQSTPHSPEARSLLEREGPNYQYGRGCLSDGVLGAWHASLYGLGELLDKEKVRSHLKAVFRHNFKASLESNAAIYGGTTSSAAAEESGLLNCTWPKGGRPTLPFSYTGAVWTGIESQVASHLILVGLVEEGLTIVRSTRRRQDGYARNPFDEAEWGSWYARAMSSYALLQAYSGARFDAVERVLYLKPATRGDFRCFLSTATGYGHVGVSDGRPFVSVSAGTIPYSRIHYVPAP